MEARELVSLSERVVYRVCRRWNISRTWYTRDDVRQDAAIGALIGESKYQCDRGGMSKESYAEYYAWVHVTRRISNVVYRSESPLLAEPIDETRVDPDVHLAARKFVRTLYTDEFSFIFRSALFRYLRYGTVSDGVRYLRGRYGISRRRSCTIIEGVKEYVRVESSGVLNGDYG